MKKVIFLLIISLLVGCAKMIEGGNEKKPPAKDAPQIQKTAPASLNKAEVKQLENVVEVHQEFQEVNEKSEWLSTIHPLELRDISFVRMSAFSMDLESSYVLHYRIYNKGRWGDWNILPESKTQVNPRRKVFSGLNILQEIEKIQFRSSNATNSPVVFRLFVAHNQR